MDVVVIVEAVVLVAGVVFSVVKEVDVNVDDTVSVNVATVAVDVERVEAGFVVDRQPLASIQINHGHNILDSFIIERKIASILFHKITFTIFE